MKRSLTLALTLLIPLVSGCPRNVTSGRGLHLPAGNADNGKAAFVALDCTRCHSVAGVDLPKPTEPPESVVVLGGAVTQLRTVGDLLTSIIHPSYGISEKMRPSATPGPVESPMPMVNDRMTVTQMIDLVTFLQPHYTKILPPTDWSYSL